MKQATRKGFGFGFTSGIITTLGLMVGLNYSTGSRSVVLGGILLIAVADSLSDAFGMHISEEAEIVHTAKEIWLSTLATFLSKLFFALTFAVPILLLALNLAVIVNIIWGLVLIASFSFYIARQEKLPSHRVILEHLGIAILVVVLTRYLGELIRQAF